MIPESPKIDSRTAVEVADQARALLRHFAPEWNGDASDPLAAALIAIFARYAEIIIQRLNEAPRKNFLSFLDLLGASLLPPQPARAPLTFSLAAGSAAPGVVPPGTQIAAAPAEGETEPVIYETERELVVTAAQLVSIFARDPQQDRFADLSAIASAVETGARLLLDGDMQIEHSLYLGDRQLLGLPSLKSVSLTITFDPVPHDEMEVVWEVGDKWEEITTSNLPANQATHIIPLGDIDPVPLSASFGAERHWLRGRLKTPITLAEDAQPGKLRANQLPSITAIALTGTISNNNLVAEQAFANQVPVDISKEFLPFGEKPKLGDAFALEQNEAFSQSGAIVTLDVTIANPTGDPSPTPPPVGASPDLALKWEYWNGVEWIDLGTSTPNSQGGPNLRDDTGAFTKRVGKAVFTVPEPPPSATGGKVDGARLRVRIVKGNYGVEATYTAQTDQSGKVTGYVVTPATFKPPIISLIKISYSGEKSAALEPILAYNNFVAQTAPLPFQSLQPFRAVSDPAVGGETRPTFYLGFTPPSAGAFPQRTISAYFSLVEPLFGQTENAASSGRPRLVWEYWNGQSWSKLTVRDDTAAFTRPGLIEFLPPADFSMRADFGQSRYWARARWDDGSYQFKPRARRVLLNTTMAAQAVTLRNEVLGSSDGAKNQKFSATRAPILDAPRLEVREPELPPAAEQRAIKNEEGEDAITIVPDEAGRPREIWARWRETTDFYGSGPRDRHYALDHQTGEIRFGDGVNGLIPPVGVGNIRLAQYRVGGGSSGNRPAGAIVQLKTTVPYVDKVTNYEAAAGGADAESIDSLVERAPRSIRHNGRAVTVEDFEDVAMLASPEVARAKCVPLRNLIGDPLDKNVPIDPLSRLPGLRGQVSVIVVPRSAEPKPLPSLELIERVGEYLGASSAPTAHVWVTGPLYLRVDVEVEIAIVSLAGAGAVEQAVQLSLAAFLHPLTGGLDRKGWDFGREPHLSDLYALIEATSGVDHVNLLALVERVDDADISALGLSAATAVADVKKTGRFLVYSGEHKISLKFEEE
jgi:hypothetical protein